MSSRETAESGVPRTEESATADNSTRLLDVSAEPRRPSAARQSPIFSRRSATSLDAAGSSSAPIPRSFRRRRRADVAETSFTATPVATTSAEASCHDMGVQVNLPPAVPRMGRLSLRSASFDLGNGDDLVQVPDPRPSGTSAPVLPTVKTPPNHHLFIDDEGYLTKESTTSTSSADTSRYSPVFF